jgi:3-oxoadipate CoA-transferase beta subunit
MAWRCAQDIPDGAFVNLGIGMPELVARFVPEGRRVTYHSENGILGFGGPPPPGEEDFDLVNAGKKPVSMRPGMSFFHHADSFAMIRGGHIDLAILGAFQVSATGDLANWQAGGGGVPAVGGAMDLVTGACAVHVLTDHVTRQGEPKLRERCSFPLTGVGVVSRIYTDFAVIDVRDGGFHLVEIAPGLSVEALQQVTGARLHGPGAPRPLAAPSVG